MSSRILAGRYELIEKIGEGGMAVVYKARCRLLNRFVAIKILKPEFTKDVKVIESFRRESQSAAALSHPNIVNVFDVGKEGNIHYIVMELIEGQVLSDVIKQEGPMDTRKAVSITMQMASALSTAHKNHIIHRDVKPHNILITADGTAKITDFGIAKAVNSGTIVGNRTSTIMGSVHYFSPEQARGGYVDEKSDIYSLGIVLYEMLTGRVPFDADNPVAVALMHMNDEIAPPSELVPGIPGDVEEVVLKATAKYQVNRYKSADDMFNALRLVSYSSSERRSKNMEDLSSTRVMPPVVRNGGGVSAEEEEGLPPVKSANSNRGRFIDDDDELYEDYEEKPRKAERKKTKAEGGGKGKRKIPFNKTMVLAIVLALVCAVPASKGVLWAIDVIFSPSVEVEVPDLRDKTVDEATAMLEALNLVLERGEVVSSDKEVDVIVSQSPREGNKVKEGSTIKVNVSRGSTEENDDMIIVPSVVGRSFEDAKKTLEAYGLNIRQVGEIYSDTPKDLVAEQEPEAYAAAEPGAIISVHLSKGSEEKAMINVLGMTLESAKLQLEQNGFSVESVDEDFSSTYPADQVMKQSIAPTTMVPDGSSVILTISLGLVTEEPTEPDPLPDDDAGNTNDSSSNSDPVSSGLAGSVDLVISYDDAVNNVFYMTITVVDDNGVDTVLKNEERVKETGGERRAISGKGRGTITILFDNTVVRTVDVDFGTGEFL